MPAPDGTYEFTTGTSVAAAHVSGVAALLLQRDPTLDPAGVREILTSTANPLGTSGRTDEFGHGRIDPLKALQALRLKTVGSTAPAVAHEMSWAECGDAREQLKSRTSNCDESRRRDL